MKTLAAILFYMIGAWFYFWGVMYWYGLYSIAGLALALVLPPLPVIAILLVAGTSFTNFMSLVFWVILMLLLGYYISE